MAMTDAPKRKEPEPDTDGDPSAATEKPVESASKAEDAPEAKKEAAPAGDAASPKQEAAPAGDAASPKKEAASAGDAASPKKEAAASPAKKENGDAASPKKDAAPGGDAALPKKEAAPAVDVASPKKEAAASPVKKEAAPDAKRLKPNPPEPAVVRKQVEYYLSDDNLRYDKFFSEKITADGEGWLDMQLVLQCNKMKAMRATKEDVVAALTHSTIELKEGGAAVRRPGNAPLPKLEAKPQHYKKSSVHAHNGGPVVMFSGVPKGQGWMQVKEKLKDKLPQKVAIWHVGEVTDKGECLVVTSPFEDDLKWFGSVELEFTAGAKVKAEVCYNEILQNSLKQLPKHIREKRERESRKRQKERNRPIAIGNQRFVNVGALRGRVKEILNSRSDGEMLKPDGTDYRLIKELLAYHPKGSEKSQGMTGIKVAKSTHPGGDSRCFHMVKEGGVQEDFSAKKCIDAVEANPPYVTVDKPEKRGKDESDAGTPTRAKPAAEAADKQEPTPALAAAETAAAAPAAPAAAAPAVAAPAAPAASDAVGAGAPAAAPAAPEPA